MRALAEEAGHLEIVGSVSLPTEIFTQGMAALLQRRLQAVDTNDQPLLALAAVTGRQIDQQILAILAPRHGIRAWLQRVSETGVLNVRDNQWLFSHDKLRESLLGHLSEEALRDHHRQVALAIEQAYPDDATYNQILLEHWQKAGNEVQEITYLLPVAEHLIREISDYEHGRNLVDRGLNLLASTDQRRVRLLNVQAYGYAAQGNYDRANEAAQTAYNLAAQLQDKANIAASLNQLGEVSFYLGDYDKSREHYQESFNIYTEVDDQKGVGDSLNGIGKAYLYMGDYDSASTSLLESQTIFRAVNDQLGIANSLNNLSIIFFLKGDYASARENLQQSLAIRQAVGDQAGIVCGWECPKVWTGRL
ncbi:MAG: tetratricopeptide repeat protein, partial [Chloroflexota bacterium]